jgi:uncharacterized protein YndB with AHSA1/START domain
MAHYQFESEWVVSAPIEAVFDLLATPDGYSEWLPSIKNSKLVSSGGDNRIGARATYSIKSPLFYSLDFEATLTELQRPNRIQMLARGDLIGTGTFELAQREGKTVVKYYWYVSTTKKWMNAVAPLGRPAFVWAHHSVMREGCAGLAKRLGARLISTSSRLVNHSGPSVAERTVA